MTSLADGWRSGAGQQPAVDQPRTLADLGTLRNMGDGVGTFSQAEPGDAALASTRFQRANDERQKYQDNQRLNLANARLVRDQNFNVVRDSSRKTTLDDVFAAQDRQRNTENLQGAVALAQGQVDAGRTGRAADQQQRQTQRLEDAFRTASGPDATAEQQATYQRLLDPTGKDALARQKTQAEIGKLNADADKARREASSTGVKLTETQSKDLNYYGRGNTANDRLEDQGSALTRSASGDRGALRGWVDASLRGIPFLGDTGVINTFISPERQQAEQSGREFVSSILRKDSGAAITNQEMETYGKTYLPQPGDSDEVLAQKHQARTTALQGIRDGLGTAEGMAAPLGRPDLRPNRAAAATSAPVRISTMDELARLPSGTTFIAPDGSIKRKP
ncbi:hypothetical protein [Pseudomonas capsici]|uniref:hypothetical protein n=1 Tax=Pseudomonas capsici TaxID=2810614 RepID=UPI0021F1840B|nr:hypothetical protein [Pseudomonas capsici]MCV4285890.1 hypothetical protein [Pseudomonas capsici]